MSCTVLVANPRPRSRTRTAGLHTARAIALATGGTADPHLVELADLGPALLEPDPPSEVTGALQRVRSSDLLVVASPTYKATYTGLLKVFLDLLPNQALSGVTAVPVMVMASPAHTLAVDVHLRPLLLELGATVPTAGLALRQDAIPSHEDDPPPPSLDGVLDPWIERAAPSLRVASRTRAQPA